MFGFSSFRAAVQPVDLQPTENLETKQWSSQPVGEFTDIMSRDEMLKRYGDDLKPDPTESEMIYETQTRSFNSEPKTQNKVPKNYQHPLIKQGLVK